MKLKEEKLESQMEYDRYEYETEMIRELDSSTSFELIFEEEEDDDFNLITTLSEQREKFDALFLNRKTEGYF
ncbi:hypothetical protein FWK35_00002484 [Aphis craccivora]|uniref:Uncharacterized protein n=1 Tax=Aphis craccivora TaxID=307492 RepID=A0A6G0ZQK0_APHCR|nr:hypothetical protein FWK35_00002484 [Aphis craccivora]